MNATCKELELVGPSQAEELAKAVDQRRVIQFFSARSALNPNGAQGSEGLPWEMAAWRAAERRYQAVVVRDPWEELVYALLAAAGLVGIVLGSFGILDAVSPSLTKHPLFLAKSSATQSGRKTAHSPKHRFLHINRSCRSEMQIRVVECGTSAQACIFHWRVRNAGAGSRERDWLIPGNSNPKLSSEPDRSTGGNIDSPARAQGDAGRRDRRRICHQCSNCLPRHCRPGGSGCASCRRGRSWLQHCQRLPCTSGALYN